MFYLFRMNDSFGCTSVIITDCFTAKIILFFTTREPSQRKRRAMLGTIILFWSMNSIKVAFAALSTPLAAASFRYMFHYNHFCEKNTLNTGRNF